MEAKEKIIHILIIGFHHKKGCQLEFSYPPLDSLPDAWKHLPSLAMPDGAHNYSKDTVFFHLPGLDSSLTTVYGVSCFQQIPLEEVKNRTEDMTRGTVQKAVCALSTVPLYGYIQVKMELITAAYFKGGDFSQTSLLNEAYDHLNKCLPGSLENHLDDGLSVTDLVETFQIQTLLLFKLILLERRVVFFHTPVKSLCTYILSLLSLHPGLVAEGLDQAASASPMGSPVKSPAAKCCSVLDNPQPQSSVINSLSENNLEAVTPPDEAEFGVDALSTDNDLLQDPLKNRNSGNFNTEMLSKLDLKACGLPLEIFQMGNLCFPYLSISYLDFLSSPGIRGFVAGGTNVLFKLKRDIADVLVVIEDNIEITHPELRQQLLLTREDRRFMATVLREVRSSQQPAENLIRDYFKLYVVSLLRTSLLPDGSKELDSFNPHFIAAWKNTHNFKMWIGNDHDGILAVEPGHPAAGSLSVQQIKLTLSQVMNSENGRKLNEAVASTGRAVGGAVNQAKEMFSGWLNNFMNQEQKTIKTATENV